MKNEVMMKSLVPKLGIFIILTLALLGGCKERVPEENTPAFDQLHGIVNDGKTVNEITLVNDRNNNRSKLRFPPEVSVGVYTPDTHNPNPKVIRKGFAYKAEVALELNGQKQLIPIVRTPDHLVYDVVTIRFGASLGPDNAQRTETRLKEIAQLSMQTTDKPEWGLREYTPTIKDELQGYEYIPFDENFRSMNGVRMWIGCQVGGAKITNNQQPVGCASSFHHPSGASVTYHFEYKLLPYWRQIYQEVYKFTDSVIVK